jgi:hypothetical protein
MQSRMSCSLYKFIRVKRRELFLGYYQSRSSCNITSKLCKDPVGRKQRTGTVKQDLRERFYWQTVKWNMLFLLGNKLVMKTEQEQLKVYKL